MGLTSRLKRRTVTKASEAKLALLALTMLMGQSAAIGWDGVQDYLSAKTGLDPVSRPATYQLGIFMVLVFGAVALVVVSIVLLFGMQIAGNFADGIDVTNSYSSQANATVNSTGSAFKLFGTSVLVIPAAAVLSVLIGGLIGAVTMVGQGPGNLPGAGGEGGR